MIHFCFSFDLPERFQTFCHHRPFFLLSLRPFKRILKKRPKRRRWNKGHGQMTASFVISSRPLNDVVPHKNLLFRTPTINVYSNFNKMKSESDKTFSESAWPFLSGGKGKDERHVSFEPGLLPGWLLARLGRLVISVLQNSQQLCRPAMEHSCWGRFSEGIKMPFLFLFIIAPLLGWRSPV